MVQSEAQPSCSSGGTHVVLYDGVCGLCSRLVQFLLRHDRRRVFSFASLQSAVGKSIMERSGGNPCELASFYVVADYQTAAITCLHQERRCAFRRWRLGMALDGGADSVLGPARDP